jgi:hypothetical protein
MMEATALESVAAVTPEWTTAVLAQNGIAATVSRVTSEPIGNGQMGSCYRLFIGYDAGDGPDRLIVKLPATDPASRAAGQLGYRCETTFYREVANRVHLDIPRCYFAAMNECGDGFTLVPEDLAPAQVRRPDRRLLCRSGSCLRSPDHHARWSRQIRRTRARARLGCWRIPLSAFVIRSHPCAKYNPHLAICGSVLTLLFH